MGWAVASQIAGAALLPAAFDNSPQSFDFPTTTLAVEKLDFSLPSYDAVSKSTGGFGDGTEARLGMTDSMIDPGSNEKAKQAEAMKKAEEARLARKEADKKAKQQRAEDQIREAELKKQRDAKRVAELFGG